MPTWAASRCRWRSPGGLAWFHAANVGTAAYVLLSVANANRSTYGTPEQIERSSNLPLAGRFTGTMCLSEPQAGSRWPTSPPAPNHRDDGTYRLFNEDVDLRRRSRPLENIIRLVSPRSRGAGRHARHLAVHRPEVPDDDGSLGDRTQRCDLPGSTTRWLSGTVNTALNFGEGTPPAARPARRDGLSCRPAQPGPCRHVPHDERGTAGCHLP